MLVPSLGSFQYLKLGIPDFQVD
ncbi:Protein of unknown function [Pyronema omphalodes CBS 100304]|uniref:Uncharacterized protein n=1 Tax=Pyronema omphalodes (strain CBS 100304) TaxID=1076935 RepID=U4LQC2_PYROM|nr:Protein of unknown function [Pyronema omphalodes CBS 100304]